MPDPDTAELRVRRMQRKLHHWAVDETDRCFDDLYNLVYDPRSSPSRGSGCGRTRVRVLLEPMGSHRGLSARWRRSDCLRGSVRNSRSGVPPDPVREVTIPKANGKLRSLGIATVADRVVQASLKLVLEPIFEADFHPCSYGFRPRRRAQDAIAEIHHLASGSRAYHWVFEGDITACFDEISHSALMDRVRRRIGDKRVLALVKSFLKAGILSKDLGYRDNVTGTPQGGILSPLLSNVALSVLDEHFAAKWKALGSEWTRAKHRRAGVPTMKIVRYADDFCVMVHGTRVDAEALWGEIAAVLAPMGLRLSVEKSRVCHIDEGFEFLGFRIQRQLKKGTTKHYVYTWPSKKALMSITEKVRNLTRRHKHRRWLICCADSTPSFGDGATTFSTGCPNAPSTTSTTSHGGGGDLDAQTAPRAGVGRLPSTVPANWQIREARRRCSGRRR
ncbi:reverse transcriptase family protein [Mycobacterium xenopi 4042]|uniref:Reverse transcriptase family protein n=1 Tax=Mycobacterium xenopi 4042 TaxID=1299334 RepID=X8AAL1_MYCXE|nr:reverse transcriptase family protein [Mycobacterium xenopi 4042]